MKKFLVLLMLVSAVGCTSLDAIQKNYKTLVSVQDGVDEQEAKIMAQNTIIKTMEKDYYRITAPDIKTTESALKYSDFWFVVFGHNWLSPISTDPLAKTYSELREAECLVVINKKSGEIKFNGEWYPKRANDFDWVFDRQAYNAINPLALPPGEQSHTLRE